MNKIIVATAAVGPKTQALLERIDNFRLWIIGLMVTISVVFMVYAAYLYLFAGTEPENINTAKRVILYVVLALSIALLSSLIVNIVSGLLGG
mgnify:CR=1 FL=1